MAPRDPDGPPARLRVVTFNWGRLGKGLRNNLIDLAEDTGKPHVLALQEVKGWDGTIPGYERHDAAEPGNPFSRRNVLLVRQRGVTVHKERDLDVGGPSWRGPQGGLQPPRDWPGLTIETDADGQRWDVLDVHRAWTGLLRRNMGAYTAEHRELVAFADRRNRWTPDRPLVMVGDWNARVPDRRRFGLPHLAREVSGRLLIKGIDGGLVRDCTGKARKLPHAYGSKGHRPVLLTLTARR